MEVGLKPTTQTQVGGTPHKPVLPTIQPPQTPNQAPVTLNSEFNGKTIEERPLLP